MAFQKLKVQYRVNAELQSSRENFKDGEKRKEFKVSTPISKQSQQLDRWRKQNTSSHPFHSYQGPQTVSDYCSVRESAETPPTQVISWPALKRCVIQEGNFRQPLAGAFSGNGRSSDILVSWISGPDAVSWHRTPSQL